MATETAFGNHIYQCQNTLYRQLIGGGIGARLTGMVARVIMDVWMDKMSRILKENDVKVFLMVKYVDNINLATSLIPRGYGWKKEGRTGRWKLEWIPEIEKDDETRSEELATANKIK